MIDYLIHDESGNLILWFLISATTTALIFLKMLQKLESTNQIVVSKIVLSMIFAIVTGQAIYWLVVAPVLIMIFGL